MFLSLCRLAVIPMKMWQFSQWTLSGNCPWNFWRRASWPTSDSRKTFWGLSSTSWRRTGKETSRTVICEWVLMLLLHCRSIVPGGANTRPLLWLWVVTISGLFLTWLQTHTPLLPSTSVAAPCLICYSFSFFLSFFFPVSAFLIAVSKHIVQLFAPRKAASQRFNWPISVCLYQSENSRKSLSFRAQSESASNGFRTAISNKLVWFCRRNCLRAARQKGKLFHCTTLFIHGKEE